MNSLMGFDTWSCVIAAPTPKHGGYVHKRSDSLEVAERVYMTMKDHGFRGIFHITDKKQYLGHSKHVSVDELMNEYVERMPLQIILKARCHNNKGTMSINVVLQGYTKDPNGYPVVKIDLPDLKSEHHVFNGKEVA